MRPLIASLALLGFVFFEPGVPDVKVTVKSSYEAAGDVFCGTMTASEGSGVGQTFVVAAKGPRLSTQPSGGRAGWIIDFADQKTYFLRPETNQYVVKTFHQVLVDLAKSHQTTEVAERVSGDFLSSTGVDLPSQSRRRAAGFEHETTVRETGQHKTIAGIDTKEAVLTITVHERGKLLDSDGGWVATSTVWIGPRLAGVDALVAAQRRYIKTVTKGVYETAFTEVELRNGEFVDPCMPEQVFVGARVIAETDKLDGTVLASRTVYEIERTPKEYARALSQYESQQRRLLGSGARVLGGAPPKRTRLLTMEIEYLNITDVVSEADVSIPPHFAKR